MTLPEITTREKWLAARTELLGREKAHTRERDQLNAGPWLAVLLVLLLRQRLQLRLRRHARPGCQAARLQLPAGRRRLDDRAYTLLDLTAFGRSEDWEEPKGRVAEPHGADPSFTD